MPRAIGICATCLPKAVSRKAGSDHWLVFIHRLGLVVGGISLPTGSDEHRRHRNEGVKHRLIFERLYNSGACMKLNVFIAGDA
jgi:hypothetical protein